MFDLHKDIEKYKGIPPYASELYGVYQPLLGWKSNLTKKWIQHGGRLIDPRIQGILDAHIRPGPQNISEGQFDEIITIPLEPGHRTNNPYSVQIAKDLNSELLNIIKDKIQAFVERNDGRFPEGSQWASFIDFNEMMAESDEGIMRQVYSIHRDRIVEKMSLINKMWDRDTVLIAKSKEELLNLMQYESQIATFLLIYAEGQNDHDPNELKKLFYVQKAPPLSEILRSSDPLAHIDPNDRSGALSPVGFVHLFRQYYFNLGTFLGEPVEHVWLAPGTTLELVEISTRKQIIEQTLEQMSESTIRSERDTTLKDEISDATRQANENSTKLGVSQSNTVDLYVYKGTVSAEFGVESTRSTSREIAYKQNREQSESLSNEIKQSFKSVFRTVTETTDTTSRRHVIENKTDDLINYELRRKMRRVGVQIQDIGQHLCWQVFINEPGKELGLSNLVHIAKPADLKSQPNEKETDYPPTRLVKPFEVDVVWAATENWRRPDSDGYVIFTTFQLPVEPDTGYELEVPQDGFVPLYIKSIGGRDVDDSPFSKAGGLIALTGRLVAGTNQINVGVKSNRLRWNRNVNFNLTAEVAFVLKDDVKKQIDEANKKIRENGEAANREEQRRAKEAFYKAAKERIELASNIKSRPSWDLREEERTIVYRELIERLMLDSWEREQKEKKGEDSEQFEEHRRLSHVRSEIIRTLFDVDKMLYFVAPEWWLPRKHYSQFIGRQNTTGIKSIGKRSNGALGNEVVVNWSDNEVRPDNYYITEKSNPAKLGSSLGWLLQLDGDNLRNAFLNAPWVKAVIPIRPGREKAALNWLREVAEGEDGWNADYLGTEPEFTGKKMGEVLENISDRLEKENGDIRIVLEADKVFEKGFDHLAGGFVAGLEANEVFSQWISVLPTDQIVAVKYEPTDLIKPD